MISKADAEAANWSIVKHWADGLGLEYVGVSLADCVAYNMLSTLGRIALTDLTEKAAPPKEIVDGQVQVSAH